MIKSDPLFPIGRPLKSYLSAGLAQHNKIHRRPHDAYRLLNSDRLFRTLKYMKSFPDVWHSFDVLLTTQQVLTNSQRRYSTALLKSLPEKVTTYASNYKNSRPVPHHQRVMYCPTSVPQHSWRWLHTVRARCGGGSSRLLGN